MAGEGRDARPAEEHERALRVERVEEALVGPEQLLHRAARGAAALHEVVQQRVVPLGPVERGAQFLRKLRAAFHGNSGTTRCCTTRLLFLPKLRAHSKNFRGKTGGALLVEGGVLGKVIPEQQHEGHGPGAEGDVRGVRGARPLAERPGAQQHARDGPREEQRGVQPDA